MEGLLLGLLHVALYVLVAAIVMWIIIWLLGVVGFPLPPIIVNLLWAVVAIIALILLVQLLFGAVPIGRRLL
jgi:hypothetical protein